MNFVNDAEGLKKWQTKSSTYLVRDRWIKLRADSCVTPDGHIIEPYYVVEYNDWISCLVIDNNGEAVLLRHYRHGAGDYVLELVAGTVDPGDTSPTETAKRELAEELGYVDGRLFQVGTSYANPANQTNKVHAFLAVGGGCKSAQRLEPGEDFVIERMPFKDFVELIEKQDSSAVYQSLHLAGIFFAFNFIRRSSQPALQSLKQYL